ncbi:MAG: aldo/keto reductase, partial [Burkholderiaceae bacterium]|nr:aldo/keto reductase [Burkholderiaceae bacterium]
GKYRPDAPPAAGTRAARGDKRMHESEWRPESLRIAEKLAVHASAKGVSLLHFACAWLLASRTVSAVIAGPRTLAQWQEYFAALEVQWDDADEELVDSLVAPGHPSTPGYSDPQYPLADRRTA